MLVAVGMIVWLALIPVIEAGEQTILQRSIPFERQGRVFGFAQLVENAASPLTAFLMAPIAEAVFMPLMTDGRGADLIGDWFGTGPDRGIALMFTRRRSHRCDRDGPRLDVSFLPPTRRGLTRRPRATGAPRDDGAVRIESSITSVSWIPSEAIDGLTRLPFDLGVGHYDDPPPESIEDLEGLQAAGAFRFANRLEAWAEVVDGEIVDHGQTGRGYLSLTRMGVGRAQLAFQPVAFPDLQPDA